MNEYSFANIVRECADMFGQGDAEGACRLSGEALAHHDGLLRQHSGDGNEFLKLASLHIALLGRTQLHTDAIGCGLIALCTADAYGFTHDESMAIDLMDLSASTLLPMCYAVQQIPQTDETMPHVAPMLTLLGLLTRHFRDIAQQTDHTDDPNTYSLANKYIAVVEQFAGKELAIDIDGKPADPADTKSVLAEIIGHAAALRLIEV